MQKEKELWGRRFRVIHKGLDEQEVSAFVDSLKASGADDARRLEELGSRISDLAELSDGLRNRLDALDSLAEPVEGNRFEIDNQRLERLASLVSSLTVSSEAVDEKKRQLDSLIRLAESTVVEADKEAEIIKAEAEERARTEEERIIAEARDKATAEAGRIVAEAEDSAKLIKQEAQELLATTRQMVEGEIGELFDQARQKLLAMQDAPETSASSTFVQSMVLQPPELEDSSNECEEVTDVNPQL